MTVSRPARDNYLNHLTNCLDCMGIHHLCQTGKLLHNAAVSERVRRLRDER